MDLEALSKKWQERVNNALEIQKETGEDFVPIKMSKTDLRELRLMFTVTSESDMLETIREIYKHRLYCDEDLCKGEMDNGYKCEDCFYKAIMMSYRIEG